MKSKPFCRIYGTRYIDDGTGRMVDSGGEYTFFSDGHFFVDVAIPLNRIREKLYLNGKREEYYRYDNIPAYLCFPLQNGKDSLLCFAQAAFHTFPGRETQYRQVLIYDRNEIEKNNSFIQDVLGFHFQREDDIMAMADHQVSQDEVLQTIDIPTKDYSVVSDARRVSICRIVHSLMQKEKVIVRISESTNLLETIRVFLLQLFSLLPNKDRCEISFSTARTEMDFPVLNDISLIVVGPDIQTDGQNKKVYDLDSIKACEDIGEILRFSKESQEDRDEADAIFTGDLQEDLRLIKDLYTPDAWWWNESEPDTEMFFDNLISAEEFMDRYPCFSMTHVRRKFCDRLPQIMNYQGGIMEAVLDALFYEKGHYRLPPKRYASIRKKMYDFGLGEQITVMNEQCQMVSEIMKSLTRMEQRITQNR